MPRNDEIEFWFSVGSTYTYLTVSRLGQVEAASGVRFRWRPFSVLSIMREMNNIPFSTKPVKAAYMWRDIERRASFHGLSIGLPVPFPLKRLRFGQPSSCSWRNGRVVRGLCSRDVPSLVR